MTHLPDPDTVERWPQREAGECRKCGQAVWYVYPRPLSNHLVEPRGPGRLTKEELAATIYALQVLVESAEKQEDGGHFTKDAIPALRKLSSTERSGE